MKLERSWYVLAGKDSVKIIPTTAKDKSLMKKRMKNMKKMLYHDCALALALALDPVPVLVHLMLYHDCALDPAHDPVSPSFLTQRRSGGLALASH